MRARSKLPNSARKNYGNYGYCTIALLYDISLLERRQREIKNKIQVETERKKKLELMMKVFSDIFDEEYPAVSAVIKEKLFQRWISHGCNKDIAQANIQIDSMLKELGDTMAVKRWEEEYKNFRISEVAKTV